MTRLPKWLFFALFFAGYMGAIWLHQSGYLGPQRFGDGPAVAMLGFAFALIVSFLLFVLSRLAGAIAARFRRSKVSEPHGESLRHSTHN